MCLRKSLFWSIVVGIVLSFLFSPAVFAQTDITQGLVLYLNFDDLAGKTFKDFSGNGNDGVIEGNLNLVAGKYGKAIENDGNPNFVRVKHTPSLNPVGGKGSVAAWINLSDTKDHSTIDWEHVIIHWNDDPNEYTYHFSVHLGKADLIWVQADGTWREATGVKLISTKEWHHIAGVADGKLVKAYLDGELDGIASYDGTCNVTATDIGISCKTRGVFCGFNGIIDEAAIWNRPLSDQEVKQAMQGINPNPTSVDSSWKLTSTWGDIKVK